jgi:hypothetical protein
MNPTIARAYLLPIEIVFSLLAVTTGVQADLEFSATTLDVGEVRAGEPLSHRFTFTNRGTEEVEITGVQSSCGCLTPHMSGQRFAAGEQGNVRVEINTLSPAPGPHTWQVKLSCKIGEAVTEIPLQVKARVVREIVVEPAALVMHVNGPMETEIRLTDLRSLPLSLKAVETSAPGLQARLAGEEPDSSGRLIRKIQLQVRDDFPEGGHEETLILYTNDPSYREIKVPVSIAKRSRQRITASPGRVELKTGVGSSLPARMVLIRDRDNQDVDVQAVTSDSPAVSCHWAKGPGAMATVKIKIAPNLIAEKNWQTTVRVQVAKPISQMILIPVIVSSQ